jgi:hypothetical protein
MQSAFFGLLILLTDCGQVSVDTHRYPAGGAYRGVRAILLQDAHCVACVVAADEILNRKVTEPNVRRRSALTRNKEELTRVKLVVL